MGLRTWFSSLFSKKKPKPVPMPAPKPAAAKERGTIAAKGSAPQVREVAVQPPFTQGDTFQ